MPSLSTFPCSQAGQAALSRDTAFMGRRCPLSQEPEVGHLTEEGGGSRSHVRLATAASPGPVSPMALDTGGVSPPASGWMVPMATSVGLRDQGHFSLKSSPQGLWSVPTTITPFSRGSC